ncbi:MAG TPA: inseCt neurotoxin 1c [Ruminococcaceae bacterium]|jgi:hypothetical protein|nr:inseCt neurotoxin 1c [Oscillospiraceae bacterium]
MVFFIIGYLLGVLSGIACLCLLQINRLSKSEEVKHEKSKRTDSFPLD